MERRTSFARRRRRLRHWGWSWGGAHSFLGTREARLLRENRWRQRKMRTFIVIIVPGSIIPTQGQLALMEPSPLVPSDARRAPTVENKGDFDKYTLWIQTQLGRVFSQPISSSLVFPLFAADDFRQMHINKHFTAIALKHRPHLCFKCQNANQLTIIAPLHTTSALATALCAAQAPTCEFLLVSFRIFFHKTVASSVKGWHENKITEIGTLKDRS